MEDGGRKLAKPNRWDKSIGSLSSTLHTIFPKNFPKTDSPPIPVHPPILIEVCGTKKGQTKRVELIT
jgi:hypothetical protein